MKVEQPSSSFGGGASNWLSRKGSQRPARKAQLRPGWKDTPICRTLSDNLDIIDGQYRFCFGPDVVQDDGTVKMGTIDLDCIAALDRAKRETLQAAAKEGCLPGNT